jgi:hypothetical protein
VALVYNPSTGHVSPQFHVVFDGDFTTVPYMEAGTISPNWVCKWFLVSMSEKKEASRQEQTNKDWKTFILFLKILPLKLFGVLGVGMVVPGFYLILIMNSSGIILKYSLVTVI